MSLNRKELRQQTAFLTDNPLDRVPEVMKDRFSDTKLIFDVHSHVFNEKDLPDKFLSIRFDASKLTINITDYFLTATERPLERTLKKFFKVFDGNEIQQMGNKNTKKFLF